MENYSYTSADSSPRSREIEFENTPPWDNNMDPNNYKVKFMVSYGGKIHPRSHDNQLSYIGGETKIFAVDRTIKFPTMISKIAGLCGDPEIMFKYQLPGEDLDALISVTSDDDLEHMMHEYDRLFRVSPTPARMRLFLFPNGQRDGGISGHVHEAVVASGSHEVKTTAQNNVDFLFGLERGTHAVPVPGKLHEPIPELGRVGFGQEHAELQRDMQRMQMRNPEQHVLYRRKSEDNYPGGFYMQKMPEKLPSSTGAGTMTALSSGGYWPERQLSGGFPTSPTTTHGHQEPHAPVYVIPSGTPPNTIYPPHQGMRPMAGQTSQGFYAMQRMGGDVYRDQPVYNMAPMRPSVGQPVNTPPQQPPKVAGQPEGFGVVQSSGGGNGVGIVAPDGGAYAQVGYENAGRQVYYTAAGGVVAPPPQRYYGVATSGGDMRNNSQEGRAVVAKVTHGPV